MQRIDHRGWRAGGGDDRPPIQRIKALAGQSFIHAGHIGDFRHIGDALRAAHHQRPEAAFAHMRQKRRDGIEHHVNRAGSEVLNGE